MNKSEFEPTYLFIKQHSVTKETYFDRTVNNPDDFYGIGKAWQRHLSTHGKRYAKTLWWCLFYDEESLLACESAIANFIVCIDSKKKKIKTSQELIETKVRKIAEKTCVEHESYSGDIFSLLSSKKHNPHYLNRYWKFIQYCIDANIKKTLKELGYVENHHICPKAKSLFPQYSNLSLNPWNQVVLTYDQHIVAHHMLAKAYGGGQYLAFNRMINTKSGKIRCLKVLKALKESAAMQHSLNRMGKPSPMKGKKHSDESNEKNSKSNMGRTSSMKGKHHSDESNEKNRVAHTGKKHSEESKAAIVAALIGRPVSEETRAKIGAGTRGKKHSDEHRKKNSENRKGKGTGPRATCECPNCHKVGGVGLMKRYHFNNCKSIRSV